MKQYSVFTDYLIALTEHSKKLDAYEVTYEDFVELQKLEAKILNAHNVGYYGGMDRQALYDLYKHCVKYYRLLLGLS